MNNRGNTFTNVEVEASEWLVFLDKNVVAPDDRARFEAWLGADPEHERVFRRQKSAWSVVPSLAGLEDIEALMAPGWAERLLAASRRAGQSIGAILSRPLVPAAGLAAAALVVIMLLTIERGSETILPVEPDFATALAEVRDLTLSDGSTVTLGAASSLDVNFTDEERRVTLLAGEAFFSVPKDANRPFIVTAGETRVRVIGTQFDVHRGVESVRVSVLEGVVEVTRPGVVTNLVTPAPEVKLILTGGQQVVSSKRGIITAVREIDKNDIAPWRAGRLVYVDERLSDIIADVNRYYAGEIQLDDKTIGDMRFTAAFRTDQIDRMILIITTALPLEADRPSDNRIVLRRRTEGG